MRMKSEMRRVSGRTMVLEMRIGLQDRVIRTTITVIMGMRSPPDLALLTTLLMAKTMQCPSTAGPLLQVGAHSGSIVRVATVTSSPTHKGLMMGMVASTLAPNLNPQRWWGLVG